MLVMGRWHARGDAVNNGMLDSRPMRVRGVQRVAGDAVPRLWLGGLGAVVRRGHRRAY